MSISKRVGIVILALGIMVFGAELSERLSIPGIHSLIQNTEAKVGRPLSPVSVAGVARRSSRR